MRALLIGSVIFAFLYKASPKELVAGSASLERDLPSAVARNLIDRHIFEKIERENIPRATLSTDEDFIRRVYLDLSGRIPKANTVKDFIKSTDPKKRENLIDTLIGSPAYVDRWTMWFGDLFRNTVYPSEVQGRNLFHNYIKDFVQKNKPYDRVVTELITATGNNWSVGHVNWLVKEGAMLDSETEDVYDNLAATASQTFLGVRLMCVSCHDGAGHLEMIDLWLSERRRAEFLGMSAFFAKMNIEPREVKEKYEFKLSDDKTEPYNMEVAGIRPKRSGNPPAPVYIFSGERPRPRSNPRRELARMITSDPQFARATVNRLWAAFMVNGIVEPVDGFDLKRLDPKNPPPEPWTIQPSHPELLEDLSREFRESGYNLQHVVRIIAKSNAYQLSSKIDPNMWKPEYERYFARKIPRLLTGEEVLDAIVTATDVPISYEVDGFKQKVRWAMQLPGPEEPKGTDEVWSAIEILNGFGRGDRVLQERKMRANIPQPLALMNSSFVDERISASKGILAQLLKSKTNPKDIVDELFLAALSRYPSEQEKKLAVEQMRKDRNEGAEDVLWSLFNKMDFIFNY